MSKLNYPDRLFSLSDCHGGRELYSPLKSPDVVARLSEAVRSQFPGIQHFDTFGAPQEYYQFVVREAVRLCRDNPDAGATGLFINSAARTKEHNNGQPFFRAEFGGGLCIAGTPLDVIAGVRDHIQKLEILPNKNNGLYGDHEQHRSSFTPRLLADNHGLALENIDLSQVPELPDGRTLGYVDRFGNLVLSENSVGASILQRINGLPGQRVQIKIGEVSQSVIIGKSLGDAKPGSLVIYSNDGSIEILSKWDESWTPQQQLENSAYKQFGEPAIGTSFSFDERRIAVPSGELG